MRPVIGITASFDDEKNVSQLACTYVDAIVAAGGIPVLIPMVPEEVAEEFLSSVDGILFPGGVDVDPQLYGERPIQQLGKINPLLDKLEIFLAKKVLERGIPFLGICRGCQMVTVAAGGTLIQDIPSQIGGAQKHSQSAPRWYGTHQVVIDEASRTYRIFGAKRLTVNSFHHQCVRDPGKGFVVSGHALDGIVEALELRQGFGLLLQWHPECMWKENPVFLEPFRALCSAAVEYRTSRE